MRKEIKSKREKENQVIEQMIALYCRKQHKGNELCPDCSNLTEYARMRNEKCPFMETKTFCSNCRVHCYQPEMRERIRQVMRYSGPRMLLYHPVLAIRHLLESKKEKRRIKNEH